MRKTTFFWCLLLVQTLVSGQGFQIGAFGGVSLYSGDLSPNNFGLYFSDARAAYGGFLRLEVTHWLDARLGANWAGLQSGDFNPERDLNFRSDITEYYLVGEFHLLRPRDDSRRKAFSPFLLAGAGLFTFNPEGELDGSWYELQPVGTEGQGITGYPDPYKLREFSVPVGVGVNFNLSEHLVLGLEFTGRKLFTDYLDDIGSTTVNYFDLLEVKGPLAARLSNPTFDPAGNESSTYRRGGSFKDWHHVIGMTLAFRPGSLFRGGGRNREAGCYRF